MQGQNRAIAGRENILVPLVILEIQRQLAVLAPVGRLRVGPALDHVVGQSDVEDGVGRVGPDVCAAVGTSRAEHRDAHYLEVLGGCSWG